MPLDADFLNLLTMVGTLRRYLGEDQFGNNAYGAPATFACFVDPTTTTTADGAVQNTQADLTQTTSLICDALEIKPKDRIGLPGGMIGHVTSVDTTKDETGTDLYQTVQVESTERG